MSDCGDSDEKPIVLPAVRDMVRELKRKPEEAERLLTKWLRDARAQGHLYGLTEGLTRASEPVKRTTLAELAAKGAQR